MCGIAALHGGTPQDLEAFVELLTRVNHRGHDAVGIAATNGHGIETFRHAGLVRQACSPTRAQFRTFADAVLKRGASTFIGHVRYRTSGKIDTAHSQPFVLESMNFGRFAFVHNGQLARHEFFREDLQRKGYRFHSESDSEVLAALLATSSQSTLAKAVDEVVDATDGAYSFIAMSAKELVGARDRFGVRPLCWRQTEDVISIASEVAALHPLQEGADILPGHVLSVVYNGGAPHVREHECVPPLPAPCIFEPIYISRPDQYMGNTVVSLFREALGERLAGNAPAGGDIVVGVPDSGLDAAAGYARMSGIPLCPRAIIRQHFNFSGRSFILPNAEMRSDAATRKYSVTRRLVEGKRIVVVDDSYVRGNTAPKLVRMFRDAGAREVHIRIASSPIRHPCFFGVDIPSTDALPAARFSEQEICRSIKATSFRFLPYRQMLALAKEYSGTSTWCTGCFSGSYPLSLGDF